MSTTNVIPVEAVDVLIDMLSESVHLEYKFDETMNLGSKNIIKIQKAPPIRPAPTSDRSIALLDTPSYKETPMTSEFLILAQGLNTLLEAKGLGLRDNLNYCLLEKAVLYLFKSENDYADFRSFREGLLNSLSTRTAPLS